MTNKYYSSRSGPFPGTGFPGPTGVEGVLNRNLPYSNPTASVPGPMALENRGYWTGPEVPIAWRLQNGTLVPPANPQLGPQRFYEATFETPVFDLRPDLRASASAENQAAYPIWRGGAFGAGGSCQILINGGRPGSANARLITAIPYMQVWAQESASLSDPTDVRSITPPPFGPAASGAIDVTSEFYQGSEAVLLNFIPPANPVRYWRCKLFFRFIEGQGTLPTLFTQGVAQ